MKALLALALFAAPAIAGPSYTLSGWTAAAGQPERFTITKQAGAPPATLTFQTRDGSAAAGQDYKTTSVVINADASFASTQIAVPTLVNPAKAGTTGTFGASLQVDFLPQQASAGATIIQPAPVNPTVAVDLNGAAPIPSNFDISTALHKSWGTGAIPPSSAPDNLGAFRLICGEGQVLYDDPVVFPGQPGKSHLHQFYGNTAANANSTYASLRTTGTSTCGNANRSGYWHPAMLDGKGNVVQADYADLYYKRRPLRDPKCSLTSGDPQAEGNCVPIPEGIRFIFGYDMVSGQAPSGGNHFFCVRGNTADAGHASITDAVANCPVGARLEASMVAPSCWGGHLLDSANHRDHVSYPSYGSWGYLKCDSAHPYVMPRLELKVFWTIAAGDTPALWHLSSDDMRPGLPFGSTWHADYFNAWDGSVLTMWTDNCINKMLNCSGGDLGNGLQLNGASQPSYGWVNPVHLIPLPPRP